MTERLYLADPYLARFRARVVATRDLDGRRALVLDRSAFYPEGGGQPGDRGTLGGAAVVDTQERSGEVLHVVDGPALEPGAEVEAAIDWARRFDHIRRHPSAQDRRGGRDRALARAALGRRHGPHRVRLRRPRGAASRRARRGVGRGRRGAPIGARGGPAGGPAPRGRGARAPRRPRGA